MINKIHIGDALTILRTFPDEFVHCVVTSPPYWGLRDYGTEGQLGLEKTPEEYVGKMVEVFREVKRVLRPDGSLWLNLGDSYCGSDEKSSNTGTTSVKQARNKGAYRAPYADGLKPKDLVGIPWAVAFALRADGWYLRSDIIWAKPNPMPESVRDRPTKAHEYVFLLTKNQKYYFDAEAVREKIGEEIRMAKSFRDGGVYTSGRSFNNQGSKEKATHGDGEPSMRGRNLRSVWTIATQPYPEAHFATFPEKLVEPCIKAGTSEKGCCPKCGGSWVRVVEKEKPPDDAFNKAREVSDCNVKMSPLHRSGKASGQKMQKWLNEHPPKTIGWRPSCSCGGEPVPCLVLDPFIGSGTVAKVAIQLRRNWIGIDLSEKYFELAQKRKAWTQVEM